MARRHLLSKGQVASAASLNTCNGGGMRDLRLLNLGGLVNVKPP